MYVSVIDRCLFYKFVVEYCVCVQASEQLKHVVAKSKLLSYLEITEASVEEHSKGGSFCEGGGGHPH